MINKKNTKGKHADRKTITCSYCQMKGHNIRTCHRNKKTLKVVLKKDIPNPQQLHLSVKQVKSKSVFNEAVIRMEQHNDGGHLTGDNLSTWWELFKNSSVDSKTYPWEGEGNRSEEISKFVTDVVPNTSRGHVSQEDWVVFVGNLNESDQLAVATAKKMNPDVLDILSKSDNVKVRQEVARSRILHPKTYKELSQDNSPTVRYFVGSNPNSPEEVKNALAYDKSPYVRKGVALNRDVPETTLLNMRETEEDHEVKIAIESGLLHKKWLKGRPKM